MLELTNDLLTVSLLDPQADRAKMGARYCLGGYVFQITDHIHGELLSGPTYPDSFNTFDGQGIPDAFNLSPLRAVGEPTEALIIGVGRCTLHEAYQRNEVKSFDDWHIDHGATHSHMTTQQSYHDWSLTLERDVYLFGRTLRTAVTLANIGRAPIPMRWFPHPFYPHATDALCKFNVDFTTALDSDGYTLDTSGWICRKHWPWNRTGQYLPLPHAAQAPLVVQQRHPKLGLVTASCSYTPTFFPIWGNGNTFSWEPFYERMIAPGTVERWHIDYDF